MDKMALDEARLIETGLILSDHVDIALAHFQPSQHPWQPGPELAAPALSRTPSFCSLCADRQLPISLLAINRQR